MDDIYCLINKGAGLTDEIAELLMSTAHDMMDRKVRKQRIRLGLLSLTGEITTQYKVGFMGQVVGITFNANFDWKNGSTKTEYVVRPVKNRDELLGGGWIPAKLFSGQVRSRAICN